MALAKSIIAELVNRGIIPREFEHEAVKELHTELTRRARRLSQYLAANAFIAQLSRRVANEKI